MGALFSSSTFGTRTVMDADLGLKRFPRDVKSIHKKLMELYSRRSAVEGLIRCLESYAECQAKDGSERRLKSA